MNTSLHENSSRSTSLGLFEILALFVVNTGLAGVFLLTLGHFDSLYSLVIGIFLTALIIKLFKCTLTFRDKRFDLYLLMILLIAAFFLFKPYLYVMGGQDQGLYVSMSATYERSGSAFIHDYLRQSLPEGPRQLYDEGNIQNKDVREAGKYEGNHIPGIYVSNVENSEYVYQFYPMHPIWMAIFAKVFGSDNRVYSLVFFALFSIITFFLIAYEFSGRKKLAGYLIALLLAINPLYLFFGKFPVSEMVSIAFSSLGFYCLLKYYKTAREETQQAQTNKIHLFISSLAFLNLFLNHIGGFTYIPLFYLLLLISVVFITDKKIRNHIIIYCLTVLIGYLLSLWYGLTYSWPYSHDIYSLELATRFSTIDWRIQLAIISVLMIIMPFLLSRFKSQIREFINRFQPHIFTITATLLILIIPANLYEMYNIGVQRNALPNLLFSSSSFVTILYLAPFGFILFLGAMNYCRKLRSIESFLLLFYLLLFWTLKVYVPAESGYQYYSSRYMLNEVVVYSLLAIGIYACHLLEKTDYKRYLAILLVAGMSIYSIYFTAYQLQGQEADGANQALAVVAEKIDEKDLLLATSLGHEVLTPLKYYFGLPVFAFNRLSLDDETFVEYLMDTYNDVFVILPEPLYNKNLEIVDILSYKEGIFEHPLGTIPTQFFYHHEMNLYLYKISRYEYFIKNKIIRPKNYPLTNFYSDAYWTDGNGIIGGLNLEMHPENKYVIVKTGGHNPLSNDLETLKLKLFINDIELKFSKKEGADYYFEVNPKVRKINEIRISSSTFKPKDFGINNDERPLGMDINYIMIK